MAAPTVDSHASTVRGKKGNKKYPVKNTITSPFTCEWPLLSYEDTSLILQKITSTFIPHVESLAKQPSKKSKGKKAAVSDEAKTKRAFLRCQLALGLNEVTRALEQGKLRLALVCRSAQPALMTNHLMSLSATRDTPVLCLARLSATMSPILNLKVILAVGFKKITTADPVAFDELVNFIVAKTPPIHVPWLQYKELTLDELREVVTNTVLREKASDQGTEKQKGKGKGKGALDHAQAGTSRDSQSQAGRNPYSGASPQVKDKAPIGSAHSVVAPEHAQAGTSSYNKSQARRNLDSGASPKFEDRVHPQRRAVAPEQSLEKLVLSPEEKPESLDKGVQVGESAKSQQRADRNPARKRQLSGNPSGLAKKRAKLVLRPDYKPATILPVKIIPKDLKNKKQLKQKRKKNKKKK